MRVKLILARGSALFVVDSSEGYDWARAQVQVIDGAGFEVRGLQMSDRTDGVVVRTKSKKKYANFPCGEPLGFRFRKRARCWATLIAPIWTV
jgi:hypothetical protein